MTITLHDYQLQAVDQVLKAVGDRVQKILVSSPTGTGKSYMEIALRAKLERHGLKTIIVSSRKEILQGIADKCGGSMDGLWTPIKLANAIRKGTLQADWRCIIFDEAHHCIAATWHRLFELQPGAIVVGFTATPYRGTPKSTTAFKAYWQYFVDAISIKDAVNKGVLAAPVCEYMPLIDESGLQLSREDYTEASLNAAYTEDSIKQLVSLTKDIWHRENRPTMVSLPTVHTVGLFANYAAEQGLAVGIVTGTTRHEDRQAAFRDCVACRSILVQIDVVSEGVDLPIRVLIDARPTASPVKWMQTLGRVTRPSDKRPLYVSVCDNVGRHLYLIEGMFPQPEKEKIELNLSKLRRKNASAGLWMRLGVGGKVKPCPVYMADGRVANAVWGWLVQDSRKYEIFLIDYGMLGYKAGKRVHTRAPDGSWKWGNWQACDPEELGLQPYKTHNSDWRPTPKMETWWQKDCERFNLSPIDQQERWNNTVFQTLPFLANTGGWR
jgi:superfamily II DNA or RNA helicase